MDFFFFAGSFFQLLQVYSQRPENGHALHEFSPAHLGRFLIRHLKDVGGKVQPGTLNNHFLKWLFQLDDFKSLLGKWLDITKHPL